MTDWLGMSARPVDPGPELKARVLERALAARRRPRLSLALAAGVALALLGAAGAAAWQGVAARRLGRQVARLEDAVRRYQDTLSLLRAPGTLVVQVPVAIGGVVTIFADTVTHRWLVACHNLAPNAPGEAYQLWFVTESGVRSAALMPMHSRDPMVMVLEMPREGGPVTGAAMSVEPEAGSAAPRGRMVFEVRL